MAYFRFHKSLGILPGVRLNLSKSGPSLSLGPAGLRANVGPQGIRTTAGLPGSGLSVIHRKSWRSMGGPQSGSGEKVGERDDAPDGSCQDMDRDVKASASDPRQLAYGQYEREPRAKWHLIAIFGAILLGLFVVAGMVKGVPLAWGIAAAALTLIVGNIIMRRLAS